jgi:uncharacterized LabA/DUF88 family protein
MHLAVLIDADNASAAVIGDILSEIAALGTASVKRIYGDFTTPNLSSWRKVLAEHGIQPIQQFRNTVGKNASDSALIIDAMDLLHTRDTRDLGGFCLVSSDSDFTRLATRIREDGLPVYGFGEEKTPEPFRNACNRFTYIEIFRQKAVVPSKKTAAPSKKAGTSAKKAATAKKPPPEKPAPLRNIKKDDWLRNALNQLIDAAATESGRVALASIGSGLLNLRPDFDPRNYGFRKLSDLLEELPSFKLVRDKTGTGIFIEKK